MHTFIEPLILYAVLFFRISSGTAPSEEAVLFSANAELVRIFMYNIPSLALVWYLMLKTKSLKEWGVGLPGKRDALPGLIGFALIVAVGFAVFFAARGLGGLPEGPRVSTPTSIAPWAALIVSVFVGAYLEESFFRFYLLSKREEMGLGPHRAVFVSTLLFAVCHLHAGLWGFVNAAVSGTALAYVFLRTRSLHGVSVAHGMYNVLAFVLGPA